ncbi:MAG: HAD family hydrolase [Cyanobacteria bacterium]|nr:HAD family hydrolase [Cyanobacteriota bacterium]
MFQDSVVFLDRDGTLNVEIGYIRQVEDLKLIPGAAQAVKKLNDAGIPVFLTTNQTGPARGFYDEGHVQALNQRLTELLQHEAQAYLNGIFYCPHLAKGVVAQYALECECRKPKLGMLYQALEAHPEIELKNCFIVGDKASDIDFAYNAQCQGILVQTGYGQRVLDGKYQTLTHAPHQVCKDITEAVDWILSILTSKATVSARY